jgi:hypothetical protein
MPPWSRYQNEDWKQRFKMQGTLDNTAYFAMPVAKQFIDMMGVRWMFPRTSSVYVFQS